MIRCQPSASMPISSVPHERGDDPLIETMGMLGDSPAAGEPDFATLGRVDRWILDRLATTAKKVNDSLEVFRFDEAANALYAFFWTEFCDGYVEMVKQVLRDETLAEEEKAKTRAVLRHVLLD